MTGKDLILALSVVLFGTLSSARAEANRCLYMCVKNYEVQELDCEENRSFRKAKPYGQCIYEAKQNRAECRKKCGTVERASTVHESDSSSVERMGTDSEPAPPPPPPGSEPVGASSTR